jgi:CheY-like chemotaxis protein
MYLHLVEHFRALRGGSQPRLMRASDGHLYVVKFQDNPQGSRVLANELLASRLAQQLGLPVPQAEVLELSPKLAEPLYFETPTGPRRISPGLHVGIRLVISPLEGRIYDFLPQAYVDQICNPEDFAGIQLFDLWTCNRDMRQAVYWKRSQQKKFTVTFIDHGHCFGGPDWKFPTSFKADSLPSADEGGSWLAKLDSLPPDLIFRLVHEIPPEWYSNDKGGLCDMLARLVVRRVDLRRLLAASWQPELQGTGQPTQLEESNPEAETILLVDDELAVREVIAHCLRRHGYMVLEASDGQDGLEVATQHSGTIDLLLTDLVMPRMNGKQLAREFSKLYPRAATMYMSGFSERQWGEAGTPERTAVFLPKPFANLALLDKMSEVLAARNAAGCRLNYGNTSIMSHNGNNPDTVARKKFPTGTETVNFD